MSETIHFPQHENKEEEQKQKRSSGREGRGQDRRGAEEEEKMKEEERVGRRKKSEQSFSHPPTFKLGAGQCLTFPWSSSEEIFKRPVKFNVNTLKDSKITITNCIKNRVLKLNQEERGCTSK